MSKRLLSNTNEPWTLVETVSRVSVWFAQPFLKLMKVLQDLQSIIRVKAYGQCGHKNVHGHWNFPALNPQIYLHQFLAEEQLYQPGKS